MRTIHIGSDHAGFELKRILSEELARLGFQVLDEGTDSKESCDYPLIARKLCEAVMGDESLGILICGTGIGMSIAANKHKGIRAALCGCELQARLARRHNDANILCLGARICGVELCVAITLAFLDSQFEGGRHLRRINEIES